jgi:hypothetical protein
VERMKLLKAARLPCCSPRNMPLTIQLHHSERQTALNLKRWSELLADPDLAHLPHRIETDRHGHILMSPPPAPAHGDQQSEIVYLLKTLLPQGRVVTECPLSTSDGVKAIDVAWLTAERLRTRYPPVSFPSHSKDPTIRNVSDISTPVRSLNRSSH